MGRTGEVLVASLVVLLALLKGIELFLSLGVPEREVVVVGDAVIIMLLGVILHAQFRFGTR